MTQQTKAPLDGVTVLDFSELLPGPFLTQNLLELGATVIKVERPPHGDNARKIAPGLFRSVNRGKQTLMADLKDPEQAAEVWKLAATADIVVEGYRPGVMARLAFDYETLAAANPGVIYVSLTGFGQDGPLAKVPGHDINYLAVAGVLALSGTDPARPDHGAGIPLADLCGAMYGLSSTLAALFQRQRTGRGQFLDVSLTDCAMHWMNPRLGHFDEAGLDSLQAQREDILAKPAYGVFHTADDALISIAALEDHFWDRLARLLELDPQLLALGTHHARVAQAAQINAAIAARVATFESDALLSMLIEADIPASPVVTPAALRSAEHGQRRQLLAAEGNGAFFRYPVMMAGVRGGE